jgi:ribosomal protein S18 acetylase RimI-like enzyme
MGNIREITPQDWDKLKILLEEISAEKPKIALDIAGILAKGKSWIVKFPGKQMGYFLIYEENKEIFGFCYIVIPKFYSLVGHIGIAVKKELRGKSLGKKLYDKSLQWANERQLKAIVADVWEWNIHSIKFFNNIGFREDKSFEDDFEGALRVKVRLVKKITS